MLSLNEKPPWFVIPLLDSNPFGVSYPYTPAFCTFYINIGLTSDDYFRRNLSSMTAKSGTSSSFSTWSPIISFLLASKGYYEVINFSIFLEVFFDLSRTIMKSRTRLGTRQKMNTIKANIVLNHSQMELVVIALTSWFSLIM